MGQLILKRETDQEVYVDLPDGRVGVVKVVETRAGFTRLGFDFPRDVTVHRKEVKDAIKRDAEKTVPTPAETREAVEAAIRR